jgi:hypothetical protein
LRGTFNEDDVSSRRDLRAQELLTTMRYRDGALPPPEEVLVVAVAALCVPVAPVGNRSRDERLDES